MRSACLALTFGLAACGQQPDVAPTQSATAEVEAEAIASAQPMATGSPEPTMPEKPFQALGTEPFWAVEVLPGQLRYSDPENIAGTTFPATESREATGVRYSGTMSGQPISLLVQPGTCSDGMSDTVYPWTAVLTKDGRRLQGCARKR